MMRTNNRRTGYFLVAATVPGADSGGGRLQVAARGSPCESIRSVGIGEAQLCNNICD